MVDPVQELDGTGYPFGLKGEEIHFETRIVAIADMVSALVNIRKNTKRIVTIYNNLMEEYKCILNFFR